MSKDCFNKQYKTAFANDSLPYIGGINIMYDEITNPSQYSHGLRSFLDMYIDGKLTAHGDNFYFADSSLVSLNTKERSYSADPFYVTNKKGVVLVSYGVKVLAAVAGATNYEKAYSINLEQLEYATLIEQISLRRSGAFGNISHLAGLTHLSSIDLNNTNVYGNISSLKNNTALTYINLTAKSADAKEYVYGNIEELGALTSLTNIQYSGIAGSIDEFVSRQCTAGRTSVSESSPIEALYSLQKCTFGTKIHADASSYINNLFWNKTGDVIKIGIFCRSDKSEVYEKNYTAEEIAAWQTAGKTVYDVMTDTVYEPTNQ